METTGQDCVSHDVIFRRPEVQDLREIGEELGMTCSEEELQAIAAMQVDTGEEVAKLLDMADPSVTQVKRPRCAGHRPAQGDIPTNAWAWRCDIQQEEASGHLAGRTLAIKDHVAVAGLPMSCGSKVLEHYVPDFDATVVSRILNAGGRILGKSSMEELGMTSSSSACGSQGVITNPWDASRDAGGSSSGSAVLVSSGHVNMAIGSDQGGSVRIPASFTGAVGLKPTWGLVPYTGAVSMEPSVDHLGPMANTVHDCALLLEVIAGYDEGKDPRQFPSIRVPEYSKLVNHTVRGKRVGLLKEGFELCSEEVVHAVVMNTAQALTQAGCIVKETSVPLHKAGKRMFSITAGLSCYKPFIENWGCSGTSNGCPLHPPALEDALQRGLRAKGRDLHPLLKGELLCQRYLDRRYGSLWNAKGRNLVHQLALGYDAAMRRVKGEGKGVEGEGEGEGVDVLVMPTVPHLPPIIPPHDATLPELATHAWGNNVNTIPFNLTGHPAISVNAGFSPPDPDKDRGRLPIGLMIVGRKFDEVTVLQVARAVEQLAGK